MSYILMCVFINDYLSEDFTNFVNDRKLLRDDLTISVSIYFVIFLAIAILQKPITAVTGTQIRAIKDEKVHFGFDYKDGEFEKYFNQTVTGHFGWAPRGLYYKDIVSATDMPINVVMGNIGLFGYAAGSNVSVSGVSLIDPLLAKFPIVKRGTIGHEGDAHLEYIFSRKPTFAYTPFEVWNKTLQYRLEGSEYKFIIEGDGNSSFVPVFDISNTQFIQRFSSLVGQDIKKNLDTSINAYLQNLSETQLKGNLIETIEFLGFLNIYWKPYANENDVKLFENKRNSVLGNNLLSTYEVFEQTLKLSSEEVWKHYTGKMDSETFWNNITYSLKTKSYRPVAPLIINLTNKEALISPLINNYGVVYNGENNIYHVANGTQKGTITIKVPKSKPDKEPYILKITYIINKPENSLKISSNLDKDEKTVFLHSVGKYGEFSDFRTLYLDITNPVTNSESISITMDRKTGPSMAEVAINHLEIF